MYHQLYWGGTDERARTADQIALQRISRLGARPRRLLIESTAKEFGRRAIPKERAAAESLSVVPRIGGCDYARRRRRTTGTSARSPVASSTIEPGSGVAVTGGGVLGS